MIINQLQIFSEKKLTELFKKSNQRKLVSESDKLGNRAAGKLNLKLKSPNFVELRKVEFGKSNFVNEQIWRNFIRAKI